MRTTISHSVDQGDGLRTQPIWTDRCTCTHLAAQHGPANGWNLVGPCLRCNCKRLEVAS